MDFPAATLGDQRFHIKHAVGDVTIIQSVDFFVMDDCLVVLALGSVYRSHVFVDGCIIGVEKQCLVARFQRRAILFLAC